MATSRPRSAGSPDGRRWRRQLRTSGRDLALASSLLGLMPVAWCLPERHWGPLCQALARIQPWRWRGESLARFSYAHALAGRQPGLSPALCARRQLANVYRERLQLLACHAPGHRRPRPRLEGREHLEAALAAGRGAILWVGPFVFSDLITKIALHDAGFAVSHLSRYAHGFSDSRFGERMLNPIRTGIERRFLAERLVMARQGSIGALRELTLRLRAGRLVSINAIGWAEQLYRIPLFNGAAQMAAGAPTLALRTGAALLPVFSGREGRDPWLTVIEPPLVRHDHWPREDAVKRLLLQYAALLEYYVTRWPDQFRPNALLFEPDKTGPAGTAPPT